MANKSKTFTPDGTWTPSGDMTLVGSALKLVAAASYSDDFESYSVGATPTGWIAAAGSATVQSAGGQKVMRIPTGSSVRYSGTGYTDGLLEIQIVGNYGVYSYWTTRWDNNGTKRGVVFFSGVTGAGAGASAVIGPTAGGVGAILYPTLASGEQSGLAGSRKAVTYPAVEGLQVATDANGDNQCWQYFNDVEFSRHINTAFRASGDQFGLTVNAGNHDVGFVKFWPTKIGGFSSPAITPYSLTAWKRVTVSGDFRYVLNHGLAALLEYRVDAGAWTAVPEDGDLSAAPAGASIQFRAVSTFKNNLLSNKDVIFSGLSVEIDGVWDTPASPPAAPTEITATAASDTTIGLTWTDEPTAAAYHVFKSTTNNIATATPAVFALQGAQAATVAGLAPSTPYFFWIKAENYTGGIGTESASVTATTQAATTPAAPTGLTVTSQSATAVGLAWSPVAGTSPLYSVYRAELANANRSWDAFAVIATTSATAYTDNAANSTPDPETGASYIYYVTATVGTETGPGSNPVLATFRPDNLSGLEVGDYLLPLQRAIYARLAGAGITYTNPTTGATEAVAVRDKARENDVFPLIVTGEISASAPNNTKTRAGQDVIFTTHVLSDYRGITEAAGIANKVARAISAQKLDLVSDGLAVVISKLQGIQARELGDGQTIDYAVQFFFTIYEDPAQRP